MTNSRRSPSLRYVAQHQKVSELLAKVDPGGFAEMQADLVAQYHPEGIEIQMVDVMAHLSWRIRGCLAVEAEILRRGAKADITSKIGDLAQLAAYEESLWKQFDQHTHMLDRRVKDRGVKEARMAAVLAQSKPCTNVIQ